MNTSENNGRRERTAQRVDLEAREALFTSASPGLLVGSSTPLSDRDNDFGGSPAALLRTLIIHGTPDPNTPYEGALAYAKLSEVGEVTPATVVGGAHMLPFAAPECFVGIVSAFNGGEDIVRSCASGPEMDHGAKPSSQMCPVGPTIYAAAKTDRRRVRPE